jgi:hypothetical protein
MKLNLSDPKVANLLTPPFCFFALYTNISLTDKDLDYLLNTIKRHPCYELIYKIPYIDIMKSSNLEIANAKINQIVFFDRFYNDLQCPSGIKRVLFILLGKWRYEADDFCPGLLDFRYGYVKKWIDYVTQKSLNQDRC